MPNGGGAGSQPIGSQVHRKANERWRGGVDPAPFPLKHTMANDSNSPRAGRRARALALLPSELASVAGVACVAKRLFSPGSFTGLFQVEAVALWLVVLLASILP